MNILRKEKPEQERPMLVKKSTGKYSFNCTPDICVRFEAVFVRHNSIFARHCPMSGANIQAQCIYSSIAEA